MTDAQTFAMEAHEGQMYGDVPYWHHLRAVVAILASFRYTGPWADAGWVHDTPEEPGIPEARIGELFGEWVQKVVHACYGIGKTRVIRNASMYNRLDNFPEAIPLKMADRIAHVEAAKRGSKYAEMYLKERNDFEAFIACRAPVKMRARLERAYKRLLPKRKDWSYRVTAVPRISEKGES